MYRQGHFGLGLLSTSVFALLAAELGAFDWVPLIAFAGISGGLLPDIDNKQIIPCQHHGFTHTLLFASIASIFIAIPLSLTYFYGTQIGATLPTKISEMVAQPSRIDILLLGVVLYISAFAGMVSHLLGDALSTATGKLVIRPWWPFSKNHIRFAVAKSGNSFYNLAFFITGVISHGAIYYMYL
jgi:membrane-bound metal-dependent hydrolase YbcI (DUF457 family)